MNAPTRNKGSKIAGNRLRQLCGFAATLLAVVSTLATSGAPDQLSLSLPDSPITLESSAPEARRQFRIESDEGRYNVVVSVRTSNVTHSSLQLRSLDAGSSAGEISPSAADSADGYEATLFARVEMTCQGGRFPCVDDFEVLVSGDLSAVGSSTGELSIRVEFAESFHEDAFLAIESL